MEKTTVAKIFQIGGMLATEIVKNKDVLFHKFRTAEPAEEPQAYEPVSEPLSVPLQAKPDPLPAKPDVAETATGIKAGCIPCATGHFGGCNGMLAEAMRFARSEGLASEVVIDRCGECLDELNALERKDLTPAMIDALPEWEKPLANKALETSRWARHQLEGLESVEQLEKVAATVETVRKELGREWFKKRFEEMPPEQQNKITAALKEKVEQEKVREQGQEMGA